MSKILLLLTSRIVLCVLQKERNVGSIWMAVDGKIHS